MPAVFKVLEVNVLFSVCTVILTLYILSPKVNTFVGISHSFRKFSIHKGKRLHRSLSTKAVYQISIPPAAWNRVFLAKLITVVSYGTWRFITSLTTAHQPLSWVRKIQSTHFNYMSLRPFLILYSHLRFGLPNGFFLSGFPNKFLCISHLPGEDYNPSYIFFFF